MYTCRAGHILRQHSHVHKMIVPWSSTPLLLALLMLADGSLHVALAGVHFSELLTPQGVSHRLGTLWSRVLPRWCSGMPLG